MAIKVHRKGRLDCQHPGDQIGTATVWVDSNGIDRPHYRMWVGFDESRGFGKSDYDLHIEPSSFGALAEAMIRADREEAIKAFGAALHAGILEPPAGKNWVAPRAA